MNIKKSKYRIYILALLFCLSLFVIATREKEKMISKYELGIEKIENKEYQEAQEILRELGDYKDSLKQIELAANSITYEKAIELFNEEKYEKAIKEFSQIQTFRDSQEYIERAEEQIEQINTNEKEYDEAVKSYNSGEYIDAIQKFSDLSNYKESQEILRECRKKLARLQQAKTISAGIRYSIGVINDGRIEYSGDYPVLEEELSLWEDIISISIKGNLGIGLKEDGTVVIAGKIPGHPEYYIDTKSWEDIIAVSSGQQYVVALSADGTLRAQGHNGDGQLDIDDWKDIIAISTGWRHTVGMDSKGHIYITGYGSKKQLQQIERQKDKWTDIVAISAGGGSHTEEGKLPYTVGLKQDGTVVTTQTGVIADEISKWTDIVAISAGDFHIVGLKKDGSVVSTATTSSADEVNGWSDIVAISAGYGFTLGLKSDGTVVATGFSKNKQINIEEWEIIKTYKEEWESIFDKNLRWTL